MNKTQQRQRRGLFLELVFVITQLCDLHSLSFGVMETSHVHGDSVVSTSSAEFDDIAPILLSAEELAMLKTPQFDLRLKNAMDRLLMLPESEYSEQAIQRRQIERQQQKRLSCTT